MEHAARMTWANISRRAVSVRGTHPLPFTHGMLPQLSVRAYGTKVLHVYHIPYKLGHRGTHQMDREISSCTILLSRWRSQKLSWNSQGLMVRSQGLAWKDQDLIMRASNITAPRNLNSVFISPALFHQRTIRDPPEPKANNSPHLDRQKINCPTCFLNCGF